MWLSCKETAQDAVLHSRVTLWFEKIKGVLACDIDSTDYRVVYFQGHFDLRVEPLELHVSRHL